MRWFINVWWFFEQIHKDREIMNTLFRKMTGLIFFIFSHKKNTEYLSKRRGSGGKLYRKAVIRYKWWLQFLFYLYFYLYLYSSLPYYSFFLHVPNAVCLPSRAAGCDDLYPGLPWIRIPTCLTDEWLLYVFWCFITWMSQIRQAKNNGDQNSKSISNLLHQCWYT